LGDEIESHAEIVPPASGAINGPLVSSQAPEWSYCVTLVEVTHDPSSVPYATWRRRWLIRIKMTEFSSLCTNQRWVDAGLLRASIQIGSLPHDFEMVAVILHLVDLAASVSEWTMEHKHQLAIEGMEEHAVAAVFVD
jgi:hypothetical protein